jgi:dTDP-4-amino-4,6-dideoxygalactose transaminase
MIGVAADLVGMHPQTLRIYEAKGLVTPQRTAGNTRLYSDADLDRLRLIQQLTTELGLNLAGVEHVIRLEEQIRRMQRTMERVEREMREAIAQVHRQYRRDLVRPCEADLEAAVGPRTKAVVVLHYGGFPCDMQAVREIADRHDLIVIEDAAHAPGATWRGEPCGALGLVGCFSFFSNKNMPVGEGGMVVTDDVGLAEQLRLLRSHGMTTLTWARHRGHASSYDVLLHGFNYRLDELRAAMGLVQLRRLPAENAGRAEIAARYREALHGTSGVTIPFGELEEGTTSAHHLAAALMPEGRRDDVRATLAENRIQTSVHYPPIHLFSHYSTNGAARALPRTEEVAERVMTLPLFAHMRDEQVELVIDAVLDALGAEGDL